MNLLEIKNNLVKLSYEESENPILGRFIVLAGSNKSYVAQFVNLKSDTANHFAIGKLIFTFTSDGVVDNYDGSIPNMNAEISSLPLDELLHLLPIETPIKIGNLAQSDNMLSLDVSIFERNLTVFTQKDIHQKTFISNCIKQLFQMKEKSVIIDTDNIYDDYEKIKLGVDYKLPLNSEMIDYLFEYELEGVEASTKAVIQDIFYAVQQYINSLDFKFLPIDNFVNVVTNQYKELQMPELALLKNKLLKYRDANIFANTKDEVLALKEKLEAKNCVILDLKDVEDSLQKEIISIVHNTLNSIDKYIYYFVPLNDNNSDKKLLKQIINHNHIFTTIFVNSSYKYAQELKKHAQNIIVFNPENTNNEFVEFGTFINKLNTNECIVCGKLTQDVPFIVLMSDIETDLTLDDVLGDKYQFIPAADNTQMVKIDDYGNQIPVDFSVEELEQTPPLEPITTVEPSTAEPKIQDTEEIVEIEDIQEQEEPEIEKIEEETTEEFSDNIIKPVANILDDEQDISEDNIEIDEPEIAEPDLQSEELTEADLDFIDETQPISEGEEIVEGEILTDDNYEEEQPPVVPIYSPDDNSDNDKSALYNQGDTVTHQRYGRGVIEKIIKYGNKTLCSITFENVGRRLLDPSISDLTKLD